MTDTSGSVKYNSTAPVLLLYCFISLAKHTFDLVTECKPLFITATLFLEFWKRHRASFVCEWKVSEWCEEEVWPILYITFNASHQINRHRGIHGCMCSFFLQFLLNQL